MSQKKKSPARQNNTKKPVGTQAAVKQNTPLIALAAVLVVAVIMIIVLLTQSNSLNAQVDTLNTELTESRATLQQTITDKEAVEEQLSLAQDDLKEAVATLEESTAKVADLEVQLSNLTAENNANKEQIAVLTADLETAKANKAAAEVYLANVQNSIEMALNALNGGAPAATEAPVVEEPVVEEPVVEEPAVEEPVVEEPVVEEPVVEEPVVEEPVEEPVVEEPVVEEPVVEEPVVEEPVVEEPVVEEPAVEEPVVEEPAAPAPIAVRQLENGDYTVSQNHVFASVKLTEEQAIASLEVVNDLTVMGSDFAAQFIGKPLTLTIEDVTLDDAGLVAQVVTLLNALAAQLAQ